MLAKVEDKNKEFYNYCDYLQDKKGVSEIFINEFIMLFGHDKEQLKNNLVKRGFIENE